MFEVEPSEGEGSLTAETRTGWQYLKDMVRATITVGSVPELWDAYSWFKDSGTFEIIAIRDSLNTDYKSIVLNFTFENKIIGELQLRCENVPLQCYASQIL